MEKRLSIRTHMEKADYKKFLYSVTFFKSTKSIGFLVAIALVAAILLTIDGTGFNIVKFLGYFALLLFIGLISIILKVEKLNKAKIKSDDGLLFDSVNELNFYDDYIQVNNEAFESDSKIPYEIINKVSETKDFYLIYLKNNQASVIRKKDIDDIEENLLREILKEKLSGKVLALK